MYYILFSFSLVWQGGGEGEGKGVYIINGLESKVMLQPETC